MAEAMSLAELDAMIDAHPAPHAILLSYADWMATMRDPAGLERRVQGANCQVIYRDLHVWIHEPDTSEVLGRDEARRAGFERAA